MNIISDSSLDYLDEMTNGGLNESESDAVLYVQPTIRDVGDIGVTSEDEKGCNHICIFDNIYILSISFCTKRSRFAGG